MSRSPYSLMNLLIFPAIWAQAEEIKQKYQDFYHFEIRHEAYHNRFIKAYAVN
jgi:hypothetical protein